MSSYKPPALQGQEVAEAYRQYHSRVLGRCRSILRDSALAEEVTQEVFVRLWRYGSAFSETQSPISWLYRIAERCCFDRAKQLALSNRFVAEKEIASSRPSGRIERRDLARRLLDSMDEPFRTVALLYFVEQRTLSEIGQATQCSRQTVAKRLDLVRHQMGDAWEFMVKEIGAG